MARNKVIYKSDGGQTSVKFKERGGSLAYECLTLIFIYDNILSMGVWVLLKPGR